jgi:hypothetical protein
MIIQYLRNMTFASSVFLVFLIAGCTSQAPGTESLAETADAFQPAPTAFVGIPNTSSNLFQADGENLEDFLARIAVVEFFDGQPKGHVVYAAINDSNNLRLGASTQRSDAKRCWVYQEQSISSCSEQDMEKAFSVQPHDTPPAPKVYFAIASSDPDEMLVIFDVYNYRDLKNTIDGFRVVLNSQDGRWHEQSIQAVY